MKIIQKKSKVILFYLLIKKKIKFLKRIHFLIFQQAPSANTLDETDCLTDHEKHIESSASIIENILSTGF